MSPPNPIIDQRRFYTNKSTNLFFVVSNRGGCGRVGGGGGGVSNMSHQMLLIGICLGVTLGVAFIPLFDPDCETGTTDVKQGVQSSGDQQNSHLQGHAIQSDLEQEQEQVLNHGNDQLDYAPQPPQSEKNSREKREIVIGEKQIAVPPPVAPFLRPRYVSTELGLRKKLLVGVVLSDPSQLDRLVRINQTLTHMVDKVIFFANGTSTEMNETIHKLKALGLGGVVPIATTISLTNPTNSSSKVNNSQDELKFIANHVTLRAIKYFGDKFRNHFDYFFLTLDEFYVNGRNLMESLKRISVREDVLWGVPRNQTLTHEKSRNYSCHLESGFVMSRTVLNIFASRVSRCWSSSVLQEKLGGNLSQCFEYLLPDISCRDKIQKQYYKVVPLLEVEAALTVAPKTICVGPVQTSDKILEIHQLFCNERKTEIGKEILFFRHVMESLVTKIPLKWRKLIWPIGLSPPISPKTRFDVNKWTFFTSEQIYLRDDYSTVTLLEDSGIDNRDIQNLLGSTQKLLHKMQGTNMSEMTHQFLYGYKRFLPTRGMEYILDYQNEITQEIIRVEALRALLRAIEIVPVPFTTESKRLLLIVPITNLNVNQIEGFLDYWFSTTTDQRQNSTNIIIAIMRRSNGTAPSPESPLLSATEAGGLQKTINEYNNGKRREKLANSTITPGAGNRKVGYAFVNLRPTTHITLGMLDHFGLRNVVGLNSVVVILDPMVRLKDEFLNRVRMNTILGNQVYSPIPFVEFHPNISEFQSQHQLQHTPPEVEVHKNNGYFNTKEYRVISFYYADYSNARKFFGENLRKYIRNVTDHWTLLDLFLHGSSLNIFRATDPNLSLRSGRGQFREVDCEEDITNCVQPWIGSRAQLAKIVMSAGII